MTQPAPSNGPSEPVISAHDLTRVFGSGENAVTAVDRVDLQIVDDAGSAAAISSKCKPGSEIAKSANARPSR